LREQGYKEQNIQQTIGIGWGVFMHMI